MAKTIGIALLLAALLALAGCGGQFSGTIGDWPDDELSRRQAAPLPPAAAAPARPENPGAAG
ncbi:MAG: hypothetical protein AB1814_15275 [Thermodesulfobacteriota bacterium]